MKAVEPVWHEFAANFVFEGLDAFFAADAEVKSAGGSKTRQFSFDGEHWQVKLYYQPSGLVHPGSELPSGREFRLDEMREYRLQVERRSDEDPTGEQSFNAHLAPRWPGVEAERNDGSRVPVSMPDGLGEAVNVKVQGSNIDVTRYLDLLQEAAAAVGINRRYFDQLDPHSNVQDAERYVRLDRDASGPVHARHGPIASLGHLLEDDRSGYRKVVQDDSGRDAGDPLPGYYHTVTLGQRRVREAFPSHSLPVEIKHYYARRAADKDGDDPLSHPKLGVSYQVSRWDGTLDADEDGLAQLQRELDRTLHAVLIDAGLEIAPEHGDGPYFPDAYFDVELGEAEEPPTLNLSDIRHEQESIVVRQLADDGLSDVELEALGTLVADGGTVSPADIAEEHSRNTQSVRRALRRLDELVERKYGEVSLSSSYIAELVHDTVQEARDIHRRTVDATGKALVAAERGLDERTSALLAWCASRGVDVNTRGEAVERVRMGEVERGSIGNPYGPLRRRLRTALDLWTDAGREEAALRQAEVSFRFQDESRKRFVPFWRLLA